MRNHARILGSPIGREAKCAPAIQVQFSRVWACGGKSRSQVPSTIIGKKLQSRPPANGSDVEVCLHFAVPQNNIWDNWRVTS